MRSPTPLGFPAYAPSSALVTTTAVGGVLTSLSGALLGGWSGLAVGGMSAWLLFSVGLAALYAHEQWLDSRLLEPVRVYPGRQRSDDTID